VVQYEKEAIKNKRKYKPIEYKVSIFHIFYFFVCICLGIFLLSIEKFCYIEETKKLQKENSELEEELNFFAAESDYMIGQIEEIEELIFLIFDKISIEEEMIVLYADINVEDDCLITKINNNLLKIEENNKEINNTLGAISLHLQSVDHEPLIWPTNGYISSGFGIRKTPYNESYQFHTGVDIINNYRSEIKATADGVVVYNGYHGSYGRLIIIDHKNNYTTYYAHLDSYIVTVGEEIKRGQLIGYMGKSGRTTGVHLHYEVRYKGSPVNPYYYMVYKNDGDERLSTHY
jgi:murein DD-endopeptidase MepM/ murein hydrolase activator NlpD